LRFWDLALVFSFFFVDFMTSGGVNPSCALVLPIRNILVPQTEHTPRVTGAPRELKSAIGSCISLFSLHLKQYASKTTPTDIH
jgi:hypothetical protein